MKLTCSFKQSDKPFDSSMLKMGEMMELNDPSISDYKGSIIIRTYAGFISLSDPEITWDSYTKLKGRKLLPGESVTLTQE